MILSAGLTPAWQQILVFDAFRYGEVNRAAEVAWCASGKVFNAGIGVHHLGGPSLTLSPVGGPALPRIEAEFDALGLPYRWIETRAATRVCTTILDRATGTMTELVENGRPLTPGELDAFLHAYGEEAVRAEMAVLMGSLPQGTPDGFAFLEPPQGAAIEKILRHCGLWNPSTPRAPPPKDGWIYEPDADWDSHPASSDSPGELTFVDMDEFLATF